MSDRNPYEYLAVSYLDDCPPLEAQSVYYITADPGETITIFTAQMRLGMYAYGYEVTWANGRKSYKSVAPDGRVFRSEREARLYAVGFMRLYESAFLPDTRRALIEAEHQLSQATLF
ncbi:MAG: hypothetical protein NC301_07520 [Bacteroides sp.]|nr:hypothetical protein [Bacteroides sp.]MCM1379984.1 hypothetical protein [Bacteroides sp.]MCM1446336.1 hypothetical protein [Prevotella sp.]